jgi:hypothetical protein
MSLSTFLEKVKNNQNISFDSTLSVITENYHYEPTEFSNGLAKDRLINAAGTNEGACKIFSFSLLNQLSQQQTLNLFGDYYKKEGLEDPAGNGHQNIRNFIKYGWEGISFNQQALTPK